MHGIIMPQVLFFLVFSHGIMALGYFVQFLKEVTLALLIHFFLKVEQTYEKMLSFCKGGSKSIRME